MLDGVDGFVDGSPVTIQSFGMAETTRVVFIYKR
jgi:hypothetical protein